MVYGMEAMELKLKQASAVLGVAPKDLQNLVQFKVLRPTRRDSFYWFDNRTGFPEFASCAKFDPPRGKRRWRVTFVEARAYLST